VALELTLVDLAPQFLKRVRKKRLDDVTGQEHAGDLVIGDSVQRLLAQQPDGLEFLRWQPAHCRFDWLAQLVVVSSSFYSRSWNHGCHDHRPNAGLVQCTACGGVPG
jgi:hypothetical protein